VGATRRAYPREREVEMVYAFECDGCQIRVYSATPKRARGCPMCGEAMAMAPVDRAAGKPAARVEPGTPVPAPADDSPRATG
jgi:predicted RNA-binding Zn-ribbon protein involved in translation (DUF1610 family)